MICTGCCATLDHIVTYLFKQLHKTGKNKNEQFPKIMDIPREILQQVNLLVKSEICYSSVKPYMYLLTEIIVEKIVTLCVGKTHSKVIIHAIDQLM